MRLNQFLGKNLGISRREADEWIEKSLVRVDNQSAVLGQKITEQQEVEAFLNNHWQNLNQNLKNTTILFYKPIFCLTTRSDPQKRKTIYNFLPKKYYNLKPAGRLDYMSEGLLILSNNGNLIQQITHPKFNHTKEYLVALKTEFDKNLQKKLKIGVELDNYLLNPVEVELFKNFEKFKYLKLNPDYCWYKFTLTEGRQNQIRRICELSNQKVLRLIRIKHWKFTVDQNLYKQKFKEVVDDL